MTEPRSKFNLSELQVLKRPFQNLGNQVSYVDIAPMGFLYWEHFLAKKNSIGVSQNAPFPTKKKENQKVRQKCTNAQQVSNKCKKHHCPEIILFEQEKTLYEWYCLPINYCKTIWDSILLIYCLIAGRSFRLTLENVHSNTRMFWSVAASAFQSLSASNDNLEMTNAMEIWPSINPTTYYEVAGKYEMFAYLLALCRGSKTTVQVIHNRVTLGGKVACKYSGTGSTWYLLTCWSVTI